MMPQPARQRAPGEGASRSCHAEKSSCPIQMANKDNEKRNSSSSNRCASSLEFSSSSSQGHNDYTTLAPVRRTRHPSFASRRDTAQIHPCRNSVVWNYRMSTCALLKGPNFFRSTVPQLTASFFCRRQRTLGFQKKGQ